MTEPIVVMMSTEEEPYAWGRNKEVLMSGIYCRPHHGSLIQLGPVTKVRKEHSWSSYMMITADAMDELATRWLNSRGLRVVTTEMVARAIEEAPV